jgi:hypothetical protein
MTISSSQPPETYGSARDLPSYREMDTLLRGARFWTTFVARDQRSRLSELRQELERLADVVDTFYERLGPRHWIFTDNLSVTEIEALLKEEADPEAMEHRLIEMYCDKATLDRLLVQTRGAPGLRARSHLLERARDHYFHDEFDSCTLLLITILDGFVNDVEPSNRKGLHAREADEMGAWNSVTGHHLGLTHVLRETFLKTIKRRQDDEVFDVYRHGIVHGSIVNYNNVVVATKAWNMLSAVDDWAKATEKMQEPREELPTSPREVWASLKEGVERYERVREDRQKLATWTASTLTTADHGFDDHFMKARSEGFLSAWQSANYGRMGQYASRMLSPERTHSGWAGEARERFSSVVLTDFQIAERGELGVRSLDRPWHSDSQW